MDMAKDVTEAQNVGTHRWPFTSHLCGKSGNFGKPIPFLPTRSKP